jgi:hypothetical protein
MDSVIHIKVPVPAVRTVGDLARLNQALSPSGRRRIHMVMADKFQQMAVQNFGASPIKDTRPHPWAPLSPSYQHQIGYYGSPKLVLLGDLVRSIRFWGADSNSAVVVCTSEYSEEHQHGGGRMYRPFFPAGQDGQPTALARAEMEKAAGDEIKRLMV